MRTIIIESKRFGTNTVIVDDSEFNKLSKFRWSLCRSGKHLYPGTTINGKIVRMHRFIMNNPPGMIIDHIDGNTLNNQRYNLRICSSSQNIQNSNIRSNNKTGYKGVHYSKQRNKFVSQITARRKVYCIGSFDSPQLAAIAYNEAAIKHHGEFAKLNII